MFLYSKQSNAKIKCMSIEVDKEHCVLDAEDYDAHKVFVTCAI